MKRRFLEPGTPTSVGSLPHTDPVEAAEVALRLQFELPSAPQLPRRHPLEGMLAQVATGMTGVRVAEDGWTLTVDRRRLGPGDVDAPLDPVAFGSTRAFLRTAQANGHGGAVKLQVTGPVTLGLSLLHAGVRPGKVWSLAGAVVRGRVKAMLAECRETLPSAPVVVVLDEPGLTAYPKPGFPLGAEDTIDLLSSALAAAGGSEDVMAGVHCCGPTDWRLVLHAGPDLVSLPVEAVVPEDGAGLSAFLDRGGFVAWGAIPTDRPLGDREDVHWRRLNTLWGDLSRHGCDPTRLRMQSLITPACGLAHHRVSQVAPMYGLVRRVAERVQDQAIAARMSAGA